MSQDQLTPVQLGLKASTFISVDEPFDDRLSFPALGLLLFLMSRPDGQRDTIQDLVGSVVDSTVESVTELLRELLRYGYYPSGVDMTGI